jgi:signal transduction histidine kinase
LERKVEERTRELQQALQKEKEVVEIKSRFISIASHVFRSPLTSIELAANYIKETKSIHMSDLHDKLDTIEKQVRNMMYSLDDVLTYGRSEAGKIQVVLSDMLLFDFLEKIIEEVGNATQQTHIIHKTFENLPESLSTDEKLLRNILINLLTNAIKFSPERDSIWLIVRCELQIIHITIHDQGIGILADEKDKIFEPFIRGKETNSIQGTGLGLSIVKKAVELLAGTIAVECNPKEGTTFTVKLPIK